MTASTQSYGLWMKSLSPGVAAAGWPSGAFLAAAEGLSEPTGGSDGETAAAAAAPLSALPDALRTLAARKLAARCGAGADVPDPAADGPRARPAAPPRRPTRSRRHVQRVEVVVRRGQRLVAARRQRVDVDLLLGRDIDEAQLGRQARLALVHAAAGGVLQRHGQRVVVVVARAVGEDEE